MFISSGLTCAALPARRCDGVHVNSCCCAPEPAMPLWKCIVQRMQRPAQGADAGICSSVRAGGAKSTSVAHCPRIAHQYVRHVDMLVNWPLTASEQSRTTCNTLCQCMRAICHKCLPLICSCAMREKSINVAKYLQGLWVCPYTARAVPCQLGKCVRADLSCGDKSGQATKQL